MNQQKKRQRILMATFILVLLLIGSFILIKQFEEGKSYFEYTEEDVKMLGDFMQAEAMLYEKIGCSLENVEYEDAKQAYMLIGSVMLHRLESRIWGETLKQVYYAPGQYATALHEEIMENINTPPEVYEWAEELLKNGPEGPENLIFEARFRQGYDVYCEINGIYFGLATHVVQKVEGGKVS